MKRCDACTEPHPDVRRYAIEEDRVDARTQSTYASRTLHDLCPTCATETGAEPVC